MPCSLTADELKPKASVLACLLCRAAGIFLNVRLPGILFRGRLPATAKYLEQRLRHVLIEEFVAELLEHFV